MKSVITLFHSSRLLMATALLAVIWSAQAAPIAGTVVDANNRPVSGATVSWLGAPLFSDVASGADGRFEMEGPSTPPVGGKITVVGATATTNGTLEVSDFTRPVRLQLTPSLPPTRATGEFLMKAMARDPKWSRTLEFLPQVLAPIDPERALALAQNQGAEAVHKVLSAVADADPQKAATWGVAQFELNRRSDEGDFYLGSALARAAVSFNRPWAERWFNANREAARLNLDQDSQPHFAAVRLLTLAALAARLGHDDAPQLLADGLKLLEQLPANERVGWLTIYGGEIGFGGATLFRSYLEGQPKVSQMLILGQAIPALAKHDFPAARAAFRQLLALQNDPQIKLQDEKNEASVSQEDLNEALNQALNGLIRNAPAADDELAQWARLAPNKIYGAGVDECLLLVRLGQAAQRGGDKARALALMREAFGKAPVISYIQLLVAALTTPLDETAGREMREQALEAARVSDDQDWRRDKVGGLAGMALSFDEPAKAFVFLEKWLAVAQKNSNYGIGDRGYFAYAVGIVDWRSAQKIWQQFPSDDDNRIAFFQAMIIAFYFASDTQKRQELFDVTY